MNAQPSMVKMDTAYDLKPAPHLCNRRAAIGEASSIQQEGPQLELRRYGRVCCLGKVRMLS